MARWDSSLWMSVHAQLLKFWGMVMPFEVNSMAFSTLSHLADALLPGYSGNMFLLLVFLFTVILISWIDMGLSEVSGL